MTTDTAVLVAKEIIDDGVSITDIPFIDNPDVPISEEVKYSGDAYQLPALESDGCILETYKLSDEQLEVMFKAFSQPKIEASDVEKEESLEMEGFRYRVSDRLKAFANGKQLIDFPLIPPGMLELWRKDESLF